MKQQTKSNKQTARYNEKRTERNEQWAKSKKKRTKSSVFSLWY